MWLILLVQLGELEPPTSCSTAESRTKYARHIAYGSWPGGLKYFRPIWGHSGRVEDGRSLFLLRKSRPVMPEVVG